VTVVEFWLHFKGTIITILSSVDSSSLASVDVCACELDKMSSQMLYGYILILSEGIP